MAIHFCTMQDVADFLQIEVDEPSCERAIAEATAAIQNYTRQTLYQVIDDVLTLDVDEGQVKLFLPQLPVTSVDQVVEDGDVLVVTDDYKLGRSGILHRVGSYWYPGVQTVEVTYTHGYEDIPPDIIAVATRAAARAYQAGLLSADSSGVPGIASKGLGDYSVSFQATSGAEAAMGASAARMLLQSEKEILDYYRAR